MRVIAFRRLRDFFEGHRDAEHPLRAWFATARMANWSSPADVRRTYGSASFVGERVVFNIAGNKYRLVTLIDYRRHGVLIRWVGTHQDYDRIDVRNI